MNGRRSVGDRVFRALLRLFPAEFRGDFGDDMAADFHDQRREARARGGRGAAAGVWTRTVADLLRRAPREQVEVAIGDARYALRMMRRHAGSTLVIVVLLSMGIGANASIFGFADPVVSRPLPVPDPEGLVRVVRDGTSGAQIFSHAVYRDLAERSRAFAGMAAHQYTTVGMGTGEAAAPTGGEIVSGNYFDVFGVGPQLGRLLQPSDDGPIAGAAVVVISDGLWRERFGATPDVIGHIIRLNGHPFEVIGVAPRRFTGSYTAFSSRFWVPISTYQQARPRRQWLSQRGWEWLAITARLRRGATRADAGADLTRVGRELQREHPDPGGATAYDVVPASGLPEGQQRTARMVLLFAAIIGALVLLVTCANIAGVLQSRALARVRETSIRCALGASRGRVIRQWLTESACLALLGAAGGLFVRRLMQAALAGELQAASPVDLAEPGAGDLRVLAFTVLLAIGAGLLFGLLPAWRSAARGEAALRETGASLAGSARGHRSAFILVSVQVAVCVCLLVGAGLLTRSLRNAQAFDPGFDSSGLVLARLNLDRHGYDGPRAMTYYTTLATRLRARGDVAAVSLAAVVPLGGDQERLGFRIAGHTGPDGRATIPVDVNQVGGDYFRAAGIPIVAGRGITDADDARGKRVAVVNEALASRYWPTGNAVGQTLVLAGTDPQRFEIVGIARTIKYYSLGEAPVPYVYLPFPQVSPGAAVLHVRIAGSAGPAVAMVKREASAIDPAVTLEQTMTFDDLRQQALLQRRAMALMANAFGALALLLTVVGLYGTMSNVVQQRSREIGVRMAFGAKIRDVVGLVAGQGLRPVVAGLALGLLGAMALGRVVAGELFGISAGDPLTNLAVIAVVLAGTATALVVPIRRAIHVDPVTILRD